MADTFDSVLADVKLLTRQQIAEVARGENLQILATPPRPLTVVRHVDGVEGAPESAVKDGGVIVYDYGRLDQVADFALDTLRQLSPIDSGDYVRSHVIMLNGTVVGNADNPASQSLSAWKPGDRLTISNTMPYTRKIEIGRGGYRAHAHVYEKAAVIVNRRYGNMAKVLFTFDKAPRGGGADGINAWAWGRVQRNQGLTAEGLAANPRAAQLGIRARQNMKLSEWLTRQPTLVILENG